MAIETTTEQEETITTRLKVRMLGIRLRHDILAKLVDQPADPQWLARELKQQERAVLRSLAFLVQSGLVRLVGRKPAPGGGKKYVYRAIPNVSRDGDSLHLKHTRGEIHRFAQVLDR